MSSLIKIDEVTASSSATVALSGIDSTYDVYVAVVNSAVPATDGVFLALRVTESSSAIDSANYDIAGKLLRADTSFSNNASENQTSLFLQGNLTGTDTGEQVNVLNYIFRASDANEYTFFTTESNFLDNANNLNGLQGSGLYTVASAIDGLQYFFSSGNIASGTFTLYGIRK